MLRIKWERRNKIVYITIHDDDLPGTLKDMTVITENPTLPRVFYDAGQLAIDWDKRRHREDVWDDD